MVRGRALRHASKNRRRADPAQDSWHATREARSEKREARSEKREAPFGQRHDARPPALDLTRPAEFPGIATSSLLIRNRYDHAERLHLPLQYEIRLERATREQLSNAYDMQRDARLSSMTFRKSSSNRKISKNGSSGETVGQSNSLLKNAKMAGGRGACQAECEGKSWVCGSAGASPSLFQQVIRPDLGAPGIQRET